MLGLALCTKYKMDPAGLARHIEAYMINNSIDDISMGLLGRYEQELASTAQQVATLLMLTWCI